jgi:hypothetical protein
VRKEPTTDELRTAYESTPLQAIGISFGHALEVPSIRKALTCKAQDLAKLREAAGGKKHKRHGRPAPGQLALI